MRDKIVSALRGLEGQTIVCALSGGGDSVALLHGLLSVREELGMTVAAAHFNHCLRGAESDQDEAFVRQLCQDWGVPLTVGRGDPRNSSGKSPEEAARDLRYEFLMAREGYIATAHHGDDQVETVLLNFLRGTGLKGLCAMEPRRGRLIRPLLAVSREEIEAYLQENNLSWRTDYTNEEDGALRNRLRHHVVPLLKAENPDLTGAVARMTGLLQADEAFLEAQTCGLLEAAALEEGWDCRILQEAPAVLRRRAIRQLMDRFAVSKPAMCHVDQVEALLSDLRGSAHTPLPGGLVVRREYGVLRFENKAASASFQEITLVPGEKKSIPELGMAVCLTGPVVLEEKPDNKTAFAISCGGSAPALTVRPRRTGDRLRLSGGEKSLKKRLIDGKIPAAQRERIPVVADERGVLAVYQLGCDAALEARCGERAWIIQFIHEERETNAG